MTSHDPCFSMTFFRMAHRVVAGDLTAHLAVVSRTLASFHMGLRMRGGVARDVLAADVADRDLDGGVDGNALGPRGLVNDPNLLGALGPLPLRRALFRSGGLRLDASRQRARV